MRITIIYHSKKGKTAAYAREIALFLWQQGCDVRLSSISDCKREWHADTELWILGCWTSGYVLFGQKPSKLWRNFCSNLPIVTNRQILLFATYKFRLGRMFAHMHSCIGFLKKERPYCIASRSGFLSISDQEMLKSFLDANQ